MDITILKRLQNREFGNIWNVGSDYEEYVIYWNDGTKSSINEKEFHNILNIDEQLYDEMNIALQN